MLANILRTFVPALWGSIVGFVLSIMPVLEPLREEILSYADWITPFLSALLIGLWYAVWRWLEPRLPDWLTRLVLGSAKASVFQNEKTIPGEIVEEPWVTVENPAGLNVADLLERAGVEQQRRGRRAAGADGSGDSGEG